MDVVSLILNTENLRTLFLLVTMVCGFVWQSKWLDQKLTAFGTALRQEMNDKFVALRGEIDRRFTDLRGDMDARFATLKTNDLAHLQGDIAHLQGDVAQLKDDVAQLKDDIAQLRESMKALTFTLQKNKFLEPADKTFIDSHLDAKS